MRKILIIEDDENNLVLIRRLVELAGFDVVAARTGEAGLATLSSASPDAVLLDIGLPGIDGTEVLRRIRASDGNGDLPVIALTSFAMSGDRERLLELGCSGYIEKPYDPAKVVGQILEIIGWRER